MISHKTNQPRKSPTIHLPGVYSTGQMQQDQSDVARDGLILALWNERKDTRDIASALNMRESQVANRLAWLRDRAAA
jgi:hypothetical protein